MERPPSAIPPALPLAAFYAEADAEIGEISWRHFTENTTIHGVKHIFQGSHSKLRRMLWVTMVISSVLVFTFQIGTRAQDYLKFETTTSLQVIQGNMLEFPAVTICNQNAFRVSVAVEWGIYEIIDKIYQNENTSGLNWETFKEKIDGLNYTNFIFSAAHQKTSFIDSCRWNRRECNVETDFKTVMTDFGVCYTFNGGDNRLWTAEAGEGTGLKLVINVEQDEYMRGPQDDAGIKILLHHPNEIPIMGEYGFAAAPSAHTLVAVKKFETRTMEPPYGSCHPDNIAIPQCLEKCRVKHVIKKCGCRAAHMKIANENYTTICDLRASTSCIQTELAHIKASSNACICNPPCNHSTYEQQLYYAQLSKFNIDRLISADPAKTIMLKKRVAKARDVTQRTMEDIWIRDVALMSNIVNSTDSLYAILQNISSVFSAASGYQPPLTVIQTPSSSGPENNVMENASGAPSPSPNQSPASPPSSSSQPRNNIMEPENNTMEPENYAMESENYVIELENNVMEPENNIIENSPVAHRPNLFQQSPASKPSFTSHPHDRPNILISTFVEHDNRLMTTQYDITYAAATHYQMNFLNTIADVFKEFQTILGLNGTQLEFPMFVRGCYAQGFGTCHNAILAKAELVSFQTTSLNLALSNLNGLRKSKYEDIIGQIFDNTPQAKPTSNDHTNCLLGFESLSETRKALVTLEGHANRFIGAKTLDEYMNATDDMASIITIASVETSIDNLSSCNWLGPALSAAYVTDLSLSSSVSLADSALQRLRFDYEVFSNLLEHFKSNHIRELVPIKVLILAYLDGGLPKSKLAEHMALPRLMEMLQEMQMYETYVAETILELEKDLGKMGDAVYLIYTRLIGFPVPIMKFDKLYEMSLFTQVALTNRSDLKTLAFGSKENLKQNLVELIDLIFLEYWNFYTDVQDMIYQPLEEQVQSITTLQSELSVYTESNVIDMNFFMENFLKLDIFYKAMSYDQISQQEAFSLVSLMGELGGFMGLMLGASLMSICELLDYAITRMILMVYLRGKKVVSNLIYVSPATEA